MTEERRSEHEERAGVAMDCRMGGWKEWEKGGDGMGAWGRVGARQQTHVSSF